jgi:hypothetical protein
LKRTTNDSADKNDRRILLGDNTGGGAAMLQPINFPVRSSLDVSWAPLYTNTSILNCAKLVLRRFFREITTASVEDCLHTNDVILTANSSEDRNRTNYLAIRYNRVKEMFTHKTGRTPVNTTMYLLRIY